MAEEIEAEFLEDFGASLQPADLDRLLQRARDTGDRELRLLVLQYQTLRRVAADALYALEARGVVAPPPARDGQPVTYPLGFLQALLRDEPRTPTVDELAG